MIKHTVVEISAKHTVVEISAYVYLGLTFSNPRNNTDDV